MHYRSKAFFSLGDNALCKIYEAQNVLFDACRRRDKEAINDGIRRLKSWKRVVKYHVFPVAIMDRKFLTCCKVALMKGYRKAAMLCEAAGPSCLPKGYRIVHRRSNRDDCGVAGWAMPTLP
jgi:hypothetical protein